jgi:hypothetical protein
MIIWPQATIPPPSPACSACIGFDTPNSQENYDRNTYNLIELIDLLYLNYGNDREFVYNCIL